MRKLKTIFVIFLGILNTFWFSNICFAHMPKLGFSGFGPKESFDPNGVMLHLTPPPVPRHGIDGPFRMFMGTDGKPQKAGSVEGRLVTYASEKSEVSSGKATAGVQLGFVEGILTMEPRVVAAFRNNPTYFMCFEITRQYIHPTSKKLLNVLIKFSIKRPDPFQEKQVIHQYEPDKNFAVINAVWSNIEGIYYFATEAVENSQP